MLRELLRHLDPTGQAEKDYAAQRAQEQFERPWQQPPLRDEDKAGVAAAVNALRDRIRQDVAPNAPLLAEAAEVGVNAPRQPLDLQSPNRIR